MSEVEAVPVAAGVADDGPLVDERAVARCVAKLFEYGRLAELELFVKAGQTIVEELYQNDLSLWRAYNRGDRAMPKLAEKLAEDDPSWTLARLRRSVCFYEQSLALGGFGRWPTLSACHFEEVQPLDPDQQPPLLDEAAKDKLKVTQVRERVRAMRGNKPRALLPEKEAAADAARVLRQLARPLDQAEELARDLQTAGFGAQEVGELVAVIRSMDEQVEKFQAALTQKSKQANGSGGAA